MSMIERKFLVGLLIICTNISSAVSSDNRSSVESVDLSAIIGLSGGTSERTDSGEDIDLSAIIGISSGLGETPQATAADLKVMMHSSGLGDAEPVKKEIFVAKTEGQAYATQCDGRKVCIEAKTGLPLQVLPRAFSNIYKTTSADNGNIVEANVEAFVPLYVFAQQGVDLSDPANPSGWYQVGENPQSVKGWMQARDVMEWKQALVVSYTHPGDAVEGRKPIIMFQNLSDLENIIESDDVVTAADRIYKEIESSGSAEGVISKEPNRFVDINDKLYILPILDWKEEFVNGEDVKLLKIAAAVPNARGSDTMDNKDYVKNANTDRQDGSNSNLNDLKVDMVFVVDTTRSMQPYIDAIREMLNNIATKTESVGDIKFGIVGFRDDLTVTERLEYTAKNFTPQLVNAHELVNLLRDDVKATRVGSEDYVEEAFAGVEEGIRSNWRENSARFVILVGDASSHVLGDKKNTLKKDENALLRELRDSNLNLIAIHLAVPKAQKDHAIARQQFGKLATIKGHQDKSALYSINAEQTADFERTAQEIVERITDLYASTQQQSEIDVGKTATLEVQTKDTSVVDEVWQAALIEYIGKAANPPKDIVAWVADKDLTDIGYKSLNVRVLITKEQLSNLSTALNQLLLAMHKSDVSQSQFFDVLQNISGQTLKRPENLGNAAKLSDTGLLPAFVNSLPYKSNILSLTLEQFGSMTTAQRTQLEAELQSKLTQYTEINEKTDAWHAVNKDDPNSIVVHPLSLEYLP